MTFPRSGRPVVVHVLEAIEGGTARHVVDLTRHVAGYDHLVVIPTNRPGRVTDTGAATAMSEAGARVKHISMRRLPVHPANAVALLRLRRLIERARPSLVHTHSSIGGVLGRLAAAGRPARRLYTPHGINPGRMATMLERHLGAGTDRLIALSPSDGERLRRLAIVPEDRVAVIANGIDLVAPTRAIDLRRMAGIAPDVELVGGVIRLVPDKGPDDFVRVCVEVARRRPGTHFVLIGGGPGQSRLDRQLATAGLGEQFHQLRAVAGLGSALGALDILVQPSRTEAGPYAPLEAMRAGVPVVLSDAVGNRDVIEPGRSGVLCAVGDVRGMADAVVDLLADPTSRAVMADAGRRRLADRFDVRVMGAATARLYDEVLSAASARPSRERIRRRTTR